MADNYLIAGSTAMQFFGYKVKPKDLDVFYVKGTKKPELKSDRKVEYHAIPKFLFDGFETIQGYLTPESMYILKLSHAEYDIHWQKTVNHIHALKRDLKTKYYANSDVFLFLPQKHKEQFYNLKAYWRTIHKSKDKVKLAVKKDEFFNKKVSRKYDHDFLHEVVKYKDKPMYRKCLKDGHEVFLDEDKFKRLDRGEQLILAREEIYVIALERFLIPNNFNMCEHEAYKMALKKLVTTMSRGWFPTFIVDNYNILCKIDKNYMQIFKNKVKHNA